MQKLEMLYEGKAKKVYKTDDETLFIVDYKPFLLFLHRAFLIFA